jgi:hypothetical protein
MKDHESLEGAIPPDAGEDAARESTTDAGTFGPGSVAGGAGEGVPGEPLDAEDEPGRGPTADEATGPTGDPDEAGDGAS